jgi:inorganic pyrophosphatase
MQLDKISYGENVPNEFNVIIEIPANSTPIKYEMDKHAGVITVDRFIGTGMSYPANYGFVPNTLSTDGDPTDVVVITPFPLLPSCLIKCRAVGVLNMEDENGVDLKIIALPIKKVCQLYSDIDELEQLPKNLLEQIHYFFEHYKGLEKGKWVKLTGWGNIKAAHQEITTSITRKKQQSN